MRAGSPRCARRRTVAVGSSAWGGRSTSSRPQFSARLLRWGRIADSFQHAPEEGGGAAGGGHHIAAAEQRSIAVTHNELQFRQIPEMRGVVVK